MGSAKKDTHASNRFGLKAACITILFALLPWQLLAEQPLATQVPDLLLAKRWSNALDVRNYWVSEKYDGIRALWDGHRFWTRKGNPIHAPNWFIRGFPSRPLDGELWMGRQRFEALVGAVRKEEPVDAEWQQVRYMVFELPDGKGDFSQRLTTLTHLLEPVDNPHIQAVKQQRIGDIETLTTRLQMVVAAGGEGLMLHKASARYHTGRSDDLLKLKIWQDAEATVIAQVPGKGRFKGMMGSLLVENAAGKRFHIGSGFSTEERRHPPAVGATITYKYFGETRNGLPRFASFLRLRDTP